MESIDAVFIIANKEKEAKRATRVLKHLLLRGIPENKIHFVAPTWSDTLTSDQIFSHYDPFAQRKVPCFTYKGRCLTLGEISLSLNFWAAVDKAIAMNLQRVIIFESDVMLREDFIKRLEVINDFTSWDYISLSDGVGTHAGPNESFYSESKLHQSPYWHCFRTTDSMLFNVDFLKRMRQTAFPLRECLDWELNYQLMINKGRAYWIEPHIVEQQTMKGIIHSSLCG